MAVSFVGVQGMSGRAARRRRAALNTAHVEKPEAPKHTRAMVQAARMVPVSNASTLRPRALARAAAVAVDIPPPRDSMSPTAPAERPALRESPRCDSPAFVRARRTRSAMVNITSFVATPRGAVKKSLRTKSLECAQLPATGEVGGRYDVRVTLRDRLVTVTEKKFAGSAMAWAKAAGLSPTSLGTFHTRWRRAEVAGATLPSLKRPALEALAKAAGVSFEWLATGHGAQSVELDARYPSLEAALAAHPGRWEPGAVAQARSMRLDADSDPGEAWWTQVLDAADTGLRVALAKLPDRKVNPLEGL